VKTSTETTNSHGQQIKKRKENGKVERVCGGRQRWHNNCLTCPSSQFSPFLFAKGRENEQDVKKRKRNIIRKSKAKEGY